MRQLATLEEPPADACAKTPVCLCCYIFFLFWVCVLSTLNIWEDKVHFLCNCRKPNVSPGLQQFTDEHLFSDISNLGFIVLKWLLGRSRDLQLRAKINKSHHSSPLFFLFCLSHFQFGCSALFPLSSFPLYVVGAQCHGTDWPHLALKSLLLSGVSCQCFVLS